MKVQVKIVNLLTEKMPRVKSKEAKRMSRIANKTNSAVRKARKPGPVTIYQV